MPPLLLLPMLLPMLPMKVLLLFPLRCRLSFFALVLLLLLLALLLLLFVPPVLPLVLPLPLVLLFLQP